MELVRSMTGGRSWDENPRAAISLVNNLLVVTQTRPVHKEIAALLDLLRRAK